MQPEPITAEPGPGLVACPECRYPVLPEQWHCDGCGMHPVGPCSRCDTGREMEVPPAVVEPYWSNGIATLYHADARRLPLADGSVHCVVTSPPYYGLRKYAGVDDRCLGLESTPELYLEHLIEVFREVRRVLHPTGVVWVNLGDSYGGSGKGQLADGTHSAKHGEKQHTSKGTLTGGLPANQNHAQEPGNKAGSNGQLLGIPWRFALAMQQDGWILRQDVIWAKDAPMPESLAGTRWERCRVKLRSQRPASEGGGYALSGNATARPCSGGVTGKIPEEYQTQWQDCPGCPKCESNGGLVLRRGSWRCTSAHEHIFMFVKQMGYWSDGEAVKLAGNFEPHKPGWSSTVSERNDRCPSNEANHREWGSPGGANRRDVWKDIKPEPYGGQHFATFPPDLPRLCIQASTSEAGACGACGSQLARVLEKQKAAVTNPRPFAKVGNGDRNDTGDIYEEKETTTLGFRPTCRCPEAQQPVPATVLDPFAGTATTLLAAQRLGRRSVGADLSREYLDMAIKRLSGQTLPLLEPARA
jgi:DNA modification methylase